MLEIKDLHVKVAEADDIKILNGVNLTVRAGELHAIMGPNGSGKSTLANIVAGRSEYEVSSGDILHEGESIVEEAPDDRAKRGIFLANQYPVEIVGVRPWQMLKAASDAVRTARGEKPLPVREFSRLFDEAAASVNLSPEMMKRALNEGFSGGEKKRNEMLQALVLQPSLMIMDETDSGLDVDALKLVGRCVNEMRGPERGFLVVTHYHRILDHIKPDRVHVLVNGRIVKSGTAELALEIERNGYEALVGG